MEDSVMQRIVLFVLCAFMGSWAIGEDHVPILQGKLVPIVKPPMIEAPHQVNPQKTKAQHLRMAAAELEAAGLKEEAARFRQMADAEKPEKGIDNSTLLFHVKLIEVNLTKLRKLGMDMSSLPQSQSADSVVRLLGLEEAKQSSSAAKAVVQIPSSLPSNANNHPMSFGVLKSDDAFFSLLEALRKDKLVDVLAEPKLATVSGRAACFSCGGEIPVVPVRQDDGTTTIERKKLGVKVDILPRLMDQDHLRLEVRMMLSKLDESQKVNVGGKIIPGIRSREIDTGVEIKANQIFVISSVPSLNTSNNTAQPVEKQTESKPEAKADSAQESSDEIATLLVIKPEIVKVME
jgi:pilus assembly protein CpaC